MEPFFPTPMRQYTCIGGGAFTGADSPETSGIRLAVGCLYRGLYKLSTITKCKVISGTYLCAQTGSALYTYNMMNFITDTSTPWTISFGTAQSGKIILKRII